MPVLTSSCPVDPTFTLLVQDVAEQDLIEAEYQHAVFITSIYDAVRVSRRE